MSTDARQPDNADDGYAARAAFLADLAHLDADATLGAATWRAYAVLWHCVGRCPGGLCITAKWLGQVAGRRSPRAAMKWIGELIKRGLIEVVDTGRDRRGGISIVVFQPHPGGRRTLTDPQVQFPFMDIDIDGRAAATQGPTARQVVTSADVTAPKRPDVSAPQRPRGKPPENQGFAASGGPPADVTAPQRPPPSLYTRKESNSKPTKPQSAFNDNDNEGGDPERFGEYLPEAIDTFAAKWQVAADLATQKRKCKEEIFMIVGRSLEDWVCGSAADLVVYKGVEPEALGKILGDISQGRINGKVTFPPGCFHKAARVLSESRGIPWTKADREKARRGIPWQQSKEPVA